MRGTDAPAVLNRFPPNLRREPTPVEIAAKTDFAGLQQLHTRGETDALTLLNDTWLPALTQEAADKIAAMGPSPSPAKLAKLSLTAPDASDLHDVLLAVATKAADEAGAELAAQDIAVAEAKAAALESLIKGQAQAMAAQVTNGVTLAAARKGAQLTNPAVDVPAETIAAGVTDYLGNLAHAWEKAQIGGAVHQAETSGRFAAFAQVPDAQPMTFYVSALLDDPSVCGPCADADGTEFSSLDEAMAWAPSGGNPDCDGGPNCRCTVVAVDGGEA